jgi:hypothetical protein
MWRVCVCVYGYKRISQSADSSPPCRYLCIFIFSFSLCCQKILSLMGVWTGHLHSQHTTGWTACWRTLYTLKNKIKRQLNRINRCEKNAPSWTLEESWTRVEHFSSDCVCCCFWMETDIGSMSLLARQQRTLSESATTAQRGTHFFFLQINASFKI